MSTAQPDACILCDESSDRKAYEKPLQELQLEPEGALTDCSVADGLLGTNKQANEPRTEAFCQPTPDSDTTTIASVIPTEDTAVSNGTITRNEDPINGNEAKGTEPVEQHHDPIVVKELSVKSIDDKAKAEEQNAVRRNSLGNGQSVVKEVAVMETGHTADADDQINSLDTGHVNCEKRIGSEDSAHVASFEDCAQVISSENPVQVVDKDPCHGSLHKNIKIKSKKHVSSPIVNFCFGSKQLLLASLKPRKRRKHKRARRRSTSDANAESIADDQQTSTSETVFTNGISRKSHRRKRSRNTASYDDAQIQMYNKKQNLGNSCAAELTMDNKASKGATLGGAELASSCPSSVSNLVSGKCGGTDEKGSWHFNLLTRGLRVPQWDDDDMPNTKVGDLQHSSSTSIGYVLDERDEEYDRGRRKKVSKSKRGFSGPNPFQEEENIRSRHHGSGGDYKLSRPDRDTSF
ncbi:unnamed protein product [Urochloa humidicola]